LGKKKADNIQNAGFRQQYAMFLAQCLCKKHLDAEDILIATYYLILQGRITEAFDMFSRLDVKNLKKHLELQYDYLSAYLDFFNDKPTKAEEIAKKYKNYPIVGWRKKFETILQHLHEISGGGAKVIDEKDHAGHLTSQAFKEASFDFTIEGKNITIRSRNLKECTIRFFETDLELLFSTSAFSLQKLDQFSFINPNAQQVIVLN